MLLAVAAPAPAHAARPFAIGFYDDLFTAPGAERGAWLGQAAGVGADIVRIDIGWAVADAPTRPAGFDARDPAAPAYDFARADAAIVDATARGLRVLASFSGAPRWAEGPGRPATAPQGSWRPDPVAIEEYGAALDGATRAASPIRPDRAGRCRASRPSRSGTSRTSTRT